MSDVQHRYDLVVVGGGIVGCFVAYLARRRRPDLRILLLERNHVGGGATLLSAGLAGFISRTDDHYRLSVRSRQIYASLPAATIRPCTHQLPPYYLVHDGDLDDFRASYRGCSLRSASFSTLRRFLPITSPSSVSVLTGEPATRFAAFQLCRNLATALSSQPDGEIWEGMHVARVDAEQHDQIQLHLADGQRIACRRLVVATGPWAITGLGQAWARTVPLRNKKIVAFHLDEPPCEDAGVAYFFRERAFLLPIPEQNRWLLSVTSKTWDCEPETSRLEISSEDRELALSVLSEYLPGWQDRCRGGRYHCDAYSPMGAPLAMASKENPEIVFVGGASGVGVRLAPAVAEDALRLLDDFDARTAAG